MSDLQCPATFLIAATGAGAASAGRVHDLVEQVRGRRISAVYGSLGEAARSAQLAASELGLEPRFLDALGEPADLGDPGAGSQVVVQRFTQAVGEIADAHRGEAVLVFTYEQVMGLAIPGANRQMVRDGAGLHVTEMDVDGDGWRVRSSPTPSPGA